MSDKISYKHPLNININIYFENSVSQVVNTSTLNLYINDIHENFKKYNNNLFDKLHIDIWDYRRSDIPDNLVMNAPGTNIQIRTDIKDMAGETWAPLNFMELNSWHTENDSRLALVLSHEIGHLIDFKIENDDPSDIIIPEWRKIRGNPQQSKIDSQELMAEDILYFFGCRGAKGLFRGSHGHPSLVKGLKDMILIWNPVYRFVQGIKKFGGKVDPKNVSFYYSDSDINFFSVVFLADYNPNQRYWYSCNRDGWFEWKFQDNAWQWIPISRF